MNSTKIDEKIDLIPYFNRNFRVQLKEHFRLRLKEMTKYKFKIRELSILTGKSMESIWKFHQGRTNATLGYLLRMCDLLNIHKQELMINVRSIYTRPKKNYFNTKELNIDSLFAEWYGVWIGEGDHSPTREAISISNYSIDLLKLHIEMLNRFGFEEKRIFAEIVTSKKEAKIKIKERWSKILSLPIDQIPTVTYMENATQEGARVQVWSAGFFRVLHKIGTDVKSIIKNADNGIKIDYIQ